MLPQPYEPAPPIASLKPQWQEKIEKVRMTFADRIAEVAPYERYRVTETIYKAATDAYTAYAESLKTKQKQPLLQRLWNRKNQHSSDTWDELANTVAVAHHLYLSAARELTDTSILTALLSLKIMTPKFKHCAMISR